MAAVCREKELSEIVKLVELVLGVAVQCEDKQKYIGSIMSFDKETQAYLMKRIEFLMNRIAEDSMASPRIQDEDDIFGEEDDDEDDGMSLDQSFSGDRQARMQLETVTEENMRLQRQNSALVEEIATMRDDLQHMRSEKALVDRKVNEMSDQHNSIPGSPSQKNDEIAIELEKKDLEIIQLEKQLLSKSQALTAMQEQFSQLHQKYEVLNAQQGDYEKMQVQLSVAQKKRDEHADQAAQLKHVEDVLYETQQQLSEAEEAERKAHLVVHVYFCLFMVTFIRCALPRSPTKRKSAC